MSTKLRFKPEITQIKLNPEQAVLACTCWSGKKGNRTTTTSYLGVCVGNKRTVTNASTTTANAAKS